MKSPRSNNPRYPTNRIRAVLSEMGVKHRKLKTNRMLCETTADIFGIPYAGDLANFSKKIEACHAERKRIIRQAVSLIAKKQRAEADVKKKHIDLKQLTDSDKNAYRIITSYITAFGVKVSNIESMEELLMKASQLFEIENTNHAMSMARAITDLSRSRRRKVIRRNVLRVMGPHNCGIIKPEQWAIKASRIESIIPLLVKMNPQFESYVSAIKNKKYHLG